MRDPYLPLPLDAIEADQSGPGRLFDFLGWLLATRPHCLPTTLSGYLSQVRAHLLLHGIPLRRSALLSKVLLRLSQRPRPSRLPRQPATPQLVLAVFTDYSLSPALRLAVALAFHHMLHSREYTSYSPSSYVPHYTLLKRHVLRHAHGPHRGCYELHIPFSKSNPGNNGDSIFLLPQPASPFCLVAAFDAYLPTVAHRPAAGPLFVHPSGRFVTRDDVTAALQRHAAACGLPIAATTSHSLRCGGCVTLLDRGVPWSTVKIRGRWTTDSAATLYARMSDARAMTATVALALDNPAPPSHPLIPSLFN